MPWLQDIDLVDGETTPVTHTFTPARQDQGGVSTFVESDGVPVGDNMLTVSSKMNDTNRKIIVRLRMPMTATQTVNGVASEVVTRTLFGEFSLRFPSTSTTQERQNVVSMMESALSGSNTALQDILVNNEEFF